MDPLSTSTSSPTPTPPTPPRFKESQQNHTLIHPLLPQPKTTNTSSNCDNNNCVGHTSSTRDEYSFIVCCDTQLGMTNDCDEWETELEYSKQAVNKINNMTNRPKFCCICGDLIHMELSFYKSNESDETKKPPKFSPEECVKIQRKQFDDFKEVWSNLHNDIALVCLCGNHDIGNRPNRATIETFTNEFGNDYLAFWVNGVYNIVLNSSLISDPTDAQDLYHDQYEWLKGRLEYARHNNARMIFVFSHHPWFLYNDDEDSNDMHGISVVVDFDAPVKIPDSYFHIPKTRRMEYMELFKEYKVNAAWAGHFHQNLISKSSFGMDMITTGSLSVILKTNGKPKNKKDGEDGDDEQSQRGIRLVAVGNDTSSFTHKFLPL